MQIICCNSKGNDSNNSSVLLIIPLIFWWYIVRLFWLTVLQLLAKQKCNCIVNKQVHTYNTRNNEYHRYVYNLELYNSKPTVTGCIFYNKLPNNQFEKEFKDLLIKG
jgi:hypothetical protein